MKSRNIFLTILLLSSMGFNSQTVMNMNVYKNNGTNIQIPLNSIDSITYSVGLYSIGNGVAYDGHNYSSIILGNGQEWMSENLRTIIFSNGDPIQNITDPVQWSNLTTGAWAHYNNDSIYENPYGILYNWHVVNDSRNVCPSGWHVPTDSEWSVLNDYLGGELIAGGKMKATGTLYWLNDNIDATNESGFTGLPGGYRRPNGTFTNIGNNALWWSSTESDISNAWCRDLNSANGLFSRGPLVKENGFSVRCKKD
jgi:uncharacterized protein (TIGR02145 family)